MSTKPFDYRHVDHFCTFDLNHFWTSDKSHVADFCASDLAVRWKPCVQLPSVKSSRPMDATCFIGMRWIRPSDRCHVALSCASDPAIRWVPRGSFACVRSRHPIVATWLVSVHRIRPSDRYHVASSCAFELYHVACSRASDLVVRWMPRGSFLCVGSGYPIAATWLVSVHWIWPSYLPRDSPCTSDLAKLSATRLALHVGSGQAWRSGIIQVTNKYW